jgi:preprotein translocase subunit SecB
MNKISSALVLQRLVFDKIEFNRKDFKNDNELEFQIEVQIGVDEDDYKVTLILNAEKKDEYDFLISLSGFFTIEKDDGLTKEQSMNLIHKNAVAILMPYLRSEVTLLTAQPEMDCVVLPPFNINKMLDKSNRDE